MFVGLVDKQGFPFRPDVVSRIPAEMIELNIRATDRPSTVEFVSRNTVAFRVFKRINGVGGYAWFREVDDINPIHPPRRFAAYIGGENLGPGDTVNIHAGHLVITGNMYELTPEEVVA